MRFITTKAMLPTDLKPGYLVLDRGMIYEVGAIYVDGGWIVISTANDGPTLQFKATASVAVLTAPDVWTK